MTSALTRLKWLAAAAALSLGAAAQAQQEVKIGVIYPLTGAAASSGAEMKNALELAADIINNGAKGIPDLPFSAGGGLPGLKGAKIKLVFADHQGNPQTGATEAERLISQEKVARHRRRLQQQRHGHGEPGGRALQGSVPQRRVVVGLAHAARLQVVLPHHRARRSLRAQFLRLHEGARSQARHQDRADRDHQREHALGHRDDQARGDAGAGQRLHAGQADHLPGQEHAAHLGSADAEGGGAQGGDAVVVPGRRAALDEDLQGARLQRPT